MPSRRSFNWLPVLAIATFASGCGPSGNAGGGFSFLRAKPDVVITAEPDVIQVADTAAADPDVPAPAEDAVAVEDTPVAGPDAGAAYDPCLPCVAEEECATAQRCAQVLGSSYCAADCSVGPACADGYACVASADTAGQQIQVCVPIIETACGSYQPDGPDAGPADVGSAQPDAGSSCPGYADPATPSCCKCAVGKTCDPNGCFNGWVCNLKTCKCNTLPAQCGGAPWDAGSTATDAGSAPATCGSLDGPTTPSCCGCKGTNCAANGCYGGWYCNHDACKCQAAPDPASCSAIPDVIGSPDSVDGDVATQDAGSGGSIVTPGGGILESLDFAIVGDTRPPSKNALSLYPTNVITKIWQDVEAEQPHLPFAVTTGDYQFSSPNTGAGAAQFDLYLGAQKNFNGTVFHTLGNHECTGATASNCGLGNADGTPLLYQTFMQKMLGPLGLQKPYYVLFFGAKDNTWTAKFVFVAANAWDAAQAAWLTEQMAQPTTYTFVVRHEASYAAQAPGVTPSGEIIKNYPYTLLLAGHTHTFQFAPIKREVVIGNGGAPLATSVNYGYVVVRQRPDQALVFHAYDYATHAIIAAFVVKPDGSTTQ